MDLRPMVFCNTRIRETYLELISTSLRMWFYARI
ncbi:MAG: hypothetical protein UX25_C0006G0017, partial [Candidatus Woesebacteria bacterium GW2011_GWC2_45_9]